MVMCIKHNVEHKLSKKQEKFEKKPVVHCMKCGNHLGGDSIKIGKNLCLYCR